MTEEQRERDRLKKALVAFFTAAKSSGAIRSVNAWATASNLAPNTINPLINGTGNKRLDDETYFKLAVGASKLLGREVSVAELKDETESASNDLTPRQQRLLALLARYPEDRQDEELDALEAALEARLEAMIRKTKPPSPNG
ncbi:hypothetical protein [Azospirillum oryzae]|uniref:hypothetical protein n=1 Tax=Azospirillum oryzae TaxID=286727 RepID=UPI001ABF991A|nr:hypothetical protein [Azospirillum oryzae]